MPLETTAPFSSTPGALECHRSVRGRPRVSDDDPEFPGSLREFGQSAAIAEVADSSSAATTTTKIEIRLLGFLILARPRPTSKHERLTVH
jgi:hypothetical protein